MSAGAMSPGRVAREPRILAIDAGGTMTDTIVIDRDGDFVIGKAQTTPEDESIAIAKSAEDAFGYWKLPLRPAMGSVVAGVYSGTAMLNRLLERRGQRVGVIVTKGMEDYFKLERGVQTHLGLSYSDRLHVVTHRHTVPLVPKSRIRGVGGRIDMFGNEAIPVYEEDARAAVHDLLDAKVEAICVSLIFSYRNPLHEQAVRRIAEAVMAERGQQVPIMLSSVVCPTRLDFPRLNTVVIEAYAAEPSRRQLYRVREKFRDLGASFEPRIMASHGGTISMEAGQLVRTLVSGPIGGVVGVKYLADRIGIDNIVCSDIGGTSFDLALITGGEYSLKNDPSIEHFKLNLPLLELSSVGAGTGSFVRLNPLSRRIEIGPDSAGSRIGVCYAAGGVDTVSITDCNIVLGTLNPDYFLGGEIAIDRDRAIEGVRKQVAEPLGMSVERAAAGVIELFEESLRQAVLAKVLGRGFEPVSFALCSYGGGGPLHVGGYAAGVPFRDVLVPAWAAGFSAFGCACADYEYRFERQMDLAIPPQSSPSERHRLGQAINAAWDALADQVAAEFAKNGISRAGIRIKPYVRLQYMGQLSDLEVLSPVARIEEAGDFERIVDAFETTYDRVYARSARSPELGYFVTRVVATGTVDCEKPALPNDALQGETPPDSAFKGTRRIFWKDRTIEARIYQMEEVRAGNVIEGLAVLESPATTFVVPPGRRARLDAHRIFHLS